MLAMTIATFLALCAVLFSVCGGEVRYEHPDRYPANQRFAMLVSVVCCVLAICCARYL